jgi:hypothetical protein
VDFQPVLRLTAAAGAFRAPPMTISTASVGVFERLGRGFAIGGAVCAASQKRENAAPGITTFREWRSLPHDARTTRADRGKCVQRGAADFQKHLPA